MSRVAPSPAGWTRRPSRRAVVLALVLLAAAWRLFLGTRYAGWEESDYGNLAMVRGVLDGGFRHYDMNHMPGYYALAAAVLAVVGDAVVAARAVSLVGGLVALALAVGLADRVFGRSTALLAGLFLVFQPEFALYAASSLREPVHAAFVMGTLAAVLADRALLAGVLAGAAFLVRFDAALALAPLALVQALPGGRPSPRRLVAFLGPLAVVIAAWATYTWWDHGTARFWSHSVQVNLETGLGAEAGTPAGWLRDGLAVASALAGPVLGRHLGWPAWAGTWIGLALLALGTWGAAGRRWGALAGGLLGVWLGMGLVAQHEPGHNLYWKWLCPVVPALVPPAAAGILAVAGAARRLGGRGARAAAAILVLLAATGTLAGQLAETRRQVARSEAWYRPQLDLARWFEAEVPEAVPLLLDNIPACWIDRRPHERAMTSWFDVPVPPGDADAFADWLDRAGVGWVLWFREDWTRAPVVAPFLAGGGTWSHGPVRLVEVAREDGYGWILYRVEGRAGTASTPPSPHRGAPAP